jgi:hypothetical protein
MAKPPARRNMKKTGRVYYT